VVHDHPDYRAHLTGRHAPSPPIHRYQSAHQDLVRSYWIPVWELGSLVWKQSVLQYPVCLIVIASEYSRFYGVRTGLSEVELTGSGWAVGVMLQPASGRLLWGAPVHELTDREVDLQTLGALDMDRLVSSVHDAMAAAPAEPSNHRRAVSAYEQAVAGLGPIDDDGRLVNEIVTRVESDPGILRVEQVATEFGLRTRTLQRLIRDRLGLSPKWLIQRRRLHDAVASLKRGEISLARLASSIGYSDQAHFTRDFVRVTGMTPAEFSGVQP